MTRNARLVSFAIVGAALAAGALSAEGTVYTLSNAASGNQVLEFHRGPGGTLTAGAMAASGGLGTGAALASQGALAMGGDGNWLFAVNAGSNSISSFRVWGGGLALADTASSGGWTPVSLTVHGHLLYVLNQGGTGNISGFWVGPQGVLTPIPGSTQPLSSATASAEEIAFSPDGETLVVTEKGTGMIDTYEIMAGGVASGPATHPSNGAGPYGFTFTGRDQLLVTEAGNDSVSSYDLGHGTPVLETASIPSEGLAPCWITTTPDGDFAYVTNAHIGTIAGFGIGRRGALSFLGLTTTASIPLLDMAAAGRELYVLAEGTHQILAYRVEPDGGLTPTGAAGGLPPSAAGLAVR